MKKEEPLVSIITPVYNCEKYVEETIKSVLSQGYENWEHLIVDDASTDGTRKLLDKYQDIDPRIKVIHLEQNGGVANARNVGIYTAKGEYVAFLDSDDLWKENKLEQHMKFIRDNHLYFSYTAYDVMDEQGRYLKSITPSKLRVNYEQLLYTNVIPCCTVIIKAELIKKEKMPKIKHEDYAAWLNVLKNNGIEAVALPETLSKYRKVKGSVSANKWKTIGWNWNIYRYNQQLSFFKSVKYLAYFVVLTGLKYIKK